ncbi:indolepyruvate ferredoxin oxidoreductase, partial [Neorhizobium galegae]|nr:indolepyruvate ferredoxin oxidoreductase [Neorhizobium galegae]
MDRPRPTRCGTVQAVEWRVQVSEASNNAVMLEVRIRACHVHGQFVAKDNQRPKFTLREALENPVRDVNRIVLPPANFGQEKDKLERRWPAAVNFIRQKKLNEHFGPEEGEIGIITLGGLYNGVMRGLQQLGLADVYGNSSVPIYVMNVAYPTIDAEVFDFCLGKQDVIMVEEGAPEYTGQTPQNLVTRS